MRKIKGLICGLLLLLLLSGLPLYAAEQPLYNELLDFRLAQAEAPSVQEWLEKAPSEWEALALAQSGSYDFTAYRTALEKKKETVASSRLKQALVLAAVGGDYREICKTLEESLGKQGLMSWVFGLHLMNNGYTCSTPLSAVKEKLLSLQLEDGGWAVMGSAGDADATAMVLQALAPYRAEAETKAAAEKALRFLSAAQQPSGGYISYGAENPESAAQVLIALAALGIDGRTDPRFSKGGHTPWDAIAQYRLAEGGYAHQAGEGFSESATVQVFCAAAAEQRLQGGKEGLYLLDSPSMEKTQNTPKKLNYKPWAVGILLGVGAVWMLVLFLRKRKRGDYGMAALVIAAAIGLVLLTNFQSVEQYQAAKEKANPIGSVTFSIQCDAVSAEGTILPATAMVLGEGETVLDLLREATATHGIPMDANGGYVRGIQNLYEGEHGELSGWIYRVNGARPAVGSDAYRLQDGDVVEWVYSLTLE